MIQGANLRHHAQDVGALVEMEGLSIVYMVENCRFDSFIYIYIVEMDGWMVYSFYIHNLPMVYLLDGLYAGK